MSDPIQHEEGDGTIHHTSSPEVTLPSSVSGSISNAKDPSNNNNNVVLIPSDDERCGILVSRSARGGRFRLLKEEKKKILKDIHDNRESIQLGISSIDENDTYGHKQEFLDIICKFSTKNKRHMSNVSQLAKYIIDVFNIFENVIKLREGVHPPPQSFDSILDLMKKVDAQVKKDAYSHKPSETRFIINRCYKDMRDAILDELGQDLDNLKDGYEQKGIIIPFEVTKRHYIEYLIAYVLEHTRTCNYKTLPPTHVEALWYNHLLQTESYRNVEKMVIDKFKEFTKVDIDLNHIDNSIITDRTERETRRMNTVILYSSMLGFESYLTTYPIDESMEDHSSSCRKRKRGEGDYDASNNYDETMEGQTETTLVSSRHIEIKIEGVIGGIVSYKVSGNTHMVWILRNYAQTQGLDYTSLCLLYSGKCVSDYETVNDLGLRDCGTLHVANTPTIIEGERIRRQDKRVVASTEPIAITVKDIEMERSICCTVPGNTQMIEILKNCAEKLGVDYDSLYLSYSGKRVMDHETLNYYKLKDNDILYIIHIAKIGRQTETVVSSFEQSIVFEIKDINLGKNIFYNVSGTTRMVNILRDYAKRIGVDYSSLRLVNCDRHLMDYSTVDYHKLRDYDELYIIHVSKMFRQTETAVTSTGSILIQVKDMNSKSITFYRVYGYTRMISILRNYAERNCVNYSSLRLIDIDMRVMDYETVNYHKLKDNDKLYIFCR